MASDEIVLGTRDLNSFLGLKVRVTIWFPTETERKDVECRYQITGIGDEKIRRAVGIDSIQAVLLAFKTIGSQLGFYEESMSTRFYIGNGDYLPSHGFPEIDQT